MTEEKLIRIVRLKRIRNALTFLVLAFAFGFSTAITIINGEIDIVAIVIGSIVFLCSVAALVWQIRFVITPQRETLYRRFGSIEKAAEILGKHEECEKVYEDRYITISPFCIQSKKDIRQTLDLFDILAVYKDQRSTNTMLTTDSIVLVDAWGEQTVFQYRRRDHAKVDDAINALKRNCDPELTKFGFTVQAMDWINQNQAPLPKYDPKKKMIEPSVFEQAEKKASKPKESTAKKTQKSNQKDDSKKKKSAKK